MTTSAISNPEVFAPIDGFYLTRDGLRIHYLEWGNPMAMPLVLLHGQRAYAHAWDPVAQELRNDFRLIALDLRGRGDSDWDPQKRYFATTYCMDVEDLARGLGLKQMAIVGHDVGGGAAILFAARFPALVKAAVVVDAGPATEPPTPGATRVASELMMTPTGFRTWDDATDFLRAQRPSASDESMNIRVRNSLRQQDDGTVTWRYDLQGLQEARSNTQGRVDLWPYLRTIQCPTLIVRGARSDYLLPEIARRTAESMRTARVCEIANAGHSVWDDNLPGFTREIKAFLARLL